MSHSDTKLAASVPPSGAEITNLAEPTTADAFADLSGNADIARCAEDFSFVAPHATPAQTNKDVLHLFKHHPEIVALPVVENGMPIGLINKGLFMTNYALPYHREIYERKSCIAFMDKTPLIVEGNTSVRDIGRQAVEAGNKVLNDGFIVTRQGRYRGVGTGIDLLQALGRLEEEKNRIVHESIEYASIIQHSLLRTSLKSLEAARMADFAILWKPRDAVGGDCYFAEIREADGVRGVFVALMDCTGHGVPGALISAMMISYLDHALSVVAPNDPAGVLAKINHLIKVSLDQHHHHVDHDSFSLSEDAERRADEGMDAVCLWVDPARRTVVYAGARIPLWALGPKDKDVKEIAGDKMGIGYIRTPDDFRWTNHELHCESGTRLYFSTDGIFDQIGGKKRLAFGRKRFWKVIGDHHKAGLEVQLEHAYAALVDYQGKEQRRDDVSLFAVEL